MALEITDLIQTFLHTPDPDLKSDEIVPLWKQDGELENSNAN